jgi:hypothetical protein
MPQCTSTQHNNKGKKYDVARGVVVRGCCPSTQKAKAGGSPFQGQPGPQSETLSHKT